MEAHIQITASLSIEELAKQIRQHFSHVQRSKLVQLIQDDSQEETSTEQILNDLKEDYIALKKGTLKTRPASEFLNELKQEGLL